VHSRRGECNECALKLQTAVDDGCLKGRPDGLMAVV
jgi:hypothetical protein